MRVQPPRLTCLSNGTQSPRASPSGAISRAIASFTTATGSPPRRSVASNVRPRRSRVPAASKYPGPATARIPGVCCMRRFARPGPERHRRPAVERLEVDDGCALDAGKARQPRQRALVECLARLRRVAGAPQIDSRDQRAIDVDTAVNRIHAAAATARTGRRRRGAPATGRSAARRAHGACGSVSARRRRASP